VVILGAGDTLSTLFWGLVTLPAWILIFKIYGLYDLDTKRVSHSTADDLPRLFHSLIVGTFGLWLLFRYAPIKPLSLTQALVFLGVSLAAVLASRSVSRTAIRWLFPPERLLFVGGGPMVTVLARKLREHPEYQLEPVGFVDGVESEIGSPAGAEYLGQLADLDDICRAQRIERALILSPAAIPGELDNLIRRLRESDVQVGVLPHVVDFLGPAIEIDDIEGITMLGLPRIKMTRSSRFLKRAMDVTLSSLLLLVFSPLMLMIAVLVRVTSQGPALYSQERMGRGGQPFRMLKFRTMVVGAEEQEAELSEFSMHPVWLALAHDPRVTRFGRLLRHTSLDELPQLWNVLVGDMSLVGPRPMTPKLAEHVSGWGLRRIDLTPGITGLWQVLGRAAIPFEEMLKLDYLYVTNWSLWQDVRLLIRTLPAVLKRRGVN
jgi:exopolysaccharide biosynthesis polyprenyl glycosylphosphotransferase